MNTITLNNHQYKAVPAKGTVGIDKANYGLCAGCAFEYNSIACCESAKLVPCASRFRSDQQNIIWILQNDE